MKDASFPPSGSLHWQAQAERKEARRAVGTAGWLTIGSIGMLFAVQLVLAVVLKISGAAGGPHRSLLEYLSSCISYLFLALIPLIYISRSSHPMDEFLPFHRPAPQGLKFKDVGMLCCVGMALVLACNWPVSWVQMMEQALGFTGKIPDMPMDSSISTQVFYLVYGTVIPPLVEEILFRGAVLGRLRCCGDWFAVVVSALLFGLYHGNVGQFIFATLVGLIFGYLRIRTGSLLPGMLLHMLNNGLAGVGTVLQQHCSAKTTEMYQSLYFFILILLGAAALILWLLVEKPAAVRRLQIGESDKGMASSLAGRVSGLLTSFGGLAMVAYGAGMSVWTLVSAK